MQPIILEALSLLDRRLSRKRDEHVSRLLTLLDDSLRVIKINRKATVTESLQHFKDETANAQFEYGRQVCVEVIFVVKLTQLSFSSEAKSVIIELTSKYFDENLYMTRFRIYEEAFERHVRRCGSNIILADFRSDLVKAQYHVGSANFVRSTLSKLADDLELIFIWPAPALSPSPYPEGKMEQANRLIKLEPNIFGIGINLNYLIRRIFGRNE